MAAGGGRRWRRQLMGVAVAGVAGWVVDFAVLWLLSARLDVPVAAGAAAGFLAAGVVNFLVNRMVFEGRTSGLSGQSVRYVMLFVANLGVTSVAVSGLATAWGHHLEDGWALLAAKALVTLTLLPVNTLAYRHWVFAASGAVSPSAPEHARIESEG